MHKNSPPNGSSGGLTGREKKDNIYPNRPSERKIREITKH